MTSTLDSDAVAQYLADNPDFFVEHNTLLGKVKLLSPVTGRAVSLQERQMEIMREKYKALELQLTDLMHTAQENEVLSNKFHAWTQALLLARPDQDLPRVLITSLQDIFSVPYVTVRLWSVAEQYADAWFVKDVSDDAKLFANSLVTPYCGKNNDFEAVAWLRETSVQSTALLPLRPACEPSGTQTYGLLVLGSQDPQRFTTEMATDFLSNLSNTASAGLTCLLD